MGSDALLSVVRYAENVRCGLEALMLHMSCANMMRPRGAPHVLQGGCARRKRGYADRAHTIGL